MTRPAKTPVRNPSLSRRWWTAGIVTVVTLLVVPVVTSVVTVSLAKRAISKREPAKALEWLKIAAAFGHRHGEIDFLQSRCYRKLGNVEGFRTAILSASRRGYRQQDLEREQLLLQAQTGRMKEVDDRISQIFQTAGEDTAEVCEAYVSGLLLNFRQAEALRVIDSWSQDYPDDPFPQFVRGRIHQNANQPQEAEKSYRRALEIAPKNSEVRMQLAELLIQAKRIDEALSILRSLTNDSKLRDLAWLRIAKCSRIQGDAAARQQALGEIKLPEQLPPGDYDLELGLLELDQQRFEVAVTHLQRSKLLQPGSTETSHALAQALRAAGRKEEGDREALFVAEAQAELQRSDTLQNELSEDFNNLDRRLEIGRILLTYGDPARGRAWVQSVLNASPSHRRANQMLADHYETLGQTSAKYAELAKQYRERAGSEAGSTKVE